MTEKKEVSCCSCVQEDKWDCSGKHSHISLAPIPGKIIERLTGDMTGKELEDTDAIKDHWCNNMESRSCWKKLRSPFRE